MCHKHVLLRPKEVAATVIMIPLSMHMCVALILPDIQYMKTRMFNVMLLVQGAYCHGWQRQP